MKRGSMLRGLLAVEWAALAYLLFTVVMMLVERNELADPVPMIRGRIAFVAATLAAWAAYRLRPCRLTLLLRIGVQMAALAWWYPDTYELNRMLPNCDHVFARLDQSLFGCQPALLFSQRAPWGWFSELMCLGYASYYPLMVVVALYYFFRRQRDFVMATSVILTSFYVYYVVFDILPVVGPQYYYPAVGLDQVAAGVLPDVGLWFQTHSEALPVPGWSGGLFHHLVEQAHAAGERPTAAFPSSHVGVTVILVLLALHSGSRRLLAVVLPLFVLMCFATVYIRAHYFVDVVAGLLTGTALYYLLRRLYPPLRLCPSAC